jgi:hypothetical protein
MEAKLEMLILERKAHLADVLSDMLQACHVDVNVEITHYERMELADGAARHAIGAAIAVYGVGEPPPISTFFSAGSNYLLVLRCIADKYLYSLKKLEDVPAPKGLFEALGAALDPRR